MSINQAWHKREDLIAIYDFFKSKVFYLIKHENKSIYSVLKRSYLSSRNIIMRIFVVVLLIQTIFGTEISERGSGGCLFDSCKCFKSLDCLKQCFCCPVKCIMNLWLKCFPFDGFQKGEPPGYCTNPWDFEKPCLTNHHCPKGWRCQFYQPSNIKYEKPTKLTFLNQWFDSFQVLSHWQVEHWRIAWTTLNNDLDFIFCVHPIFWGNKSLSKLSKESRV